MDTSSRAGEEEEEDNAGKDFLLMSFSMYEKKGKNQCMEGYTEGSVDGSFETMV